jgi:hypothetical protein
MSKIFNMYINRLQIESSKPLNAIPVQFDFLTSNVVLKPHVTHAEDRK